VNSGQQLAFLKWVLPKQELYFGESIVTELDLYIRQGIHVGQFQLTPIQAAGFNVTYTDSAGKLVQGNNRQAQIGNMVYTVVPLRVALKPVKMGELSFGPAMANIVVEVPSANRRRESLLEQFGFRDPFGTEQHQLSLVSETNLVHALPLPTQNAPHNFNGAVGSFTMTASVGPTNVAVGDPITVKIQISGRGAIE